MTDQLREQAGWRRGKTPVISKYIDEHSKIFSEIAGRGFLALPGYAYDAENRIELVSKINLSELNYKILSETIEREMKQAGIDYNLAYKNAVIVWEMDKQALLAAWDAELAGIKQDMSAKEEVLNLLAIEVSKRAITLLESKTAIEEAMEVYRRELVELDGTLSPYEVELANAKLLTAQRKLLILPVLQGIIVKERELLIKEGLKTTAYTTYMAKEQEVAAKKQTLAPFINELASKIDQYTDKIETIQIPLENQISDEKVTQAEIAVEKASYQIDEVITEIEVTEKYIDLDEAKRDLAVVKFNNAQEIDSTEIELNRNFHTEEVSQFNNLIQDERQTQTDVREDKVSTHEKQSDTKVQSATTLATASRETDSQINAAEIDQIQRVATAEAATKITAALNHLLG